MTNNEEETRPEGNNDMSPCPYCDETPCFLYQGLYESITELEEKLREADYEDKLTNKQIRYQLYRHATAFIHGFLGKGKRMEIPKCVRGEILDLAPESDGKYVGFKDGITENNEDHAD
jgi:hypothetical protein